MIRTFIVTAVFSISALQAHAVSSCPNLSGEYSTQDGKQRMKITVNNAPGWLEYNFGEGSSPVLADGTIHSIGTGTYTTTCENDSVSTVVTMDGSIVLKFSYTRINENGDIRGVSNGSDVSDVTWIKK